jgi:hypothetical protein
VTTRKLLIGIMMAVSLILFQPSEGSAADIVNPKQTYTYEMMARDIKALAAKYPDIIKYKSIGKSEYGRTIYAVSLGTGNASVFINGSHHAREWISTNLNMHMLEQYAQMYRGNQTFGGYNVRKTLDETTIWFVPMVNPDGVTLQQYGLNKFPSSVHSSLIKMNDGSTSFKKWKANAKGVDLNRQYDADWANIHGNFPAPRWSNYKGSAPEQASETKAMVSFTKEIDPEMAIAYHTSGEILYWYFNQTGKIYTRDQTHAKKLGQLTGYSLVPAVSNPSGGGYTDWFIEKFDRPGFTPELGTYSGNSHVALSQFSSIWTENKYVGLYAASEGYKLYLARGGEPKPQEVRVKIDGNLIDLEQPALSIDGRTMVPVRGVFEKLGAEVKWDQATRTITAKSGSATIVLKAGSKTAYINGEASTLDVPPRIINNYTLIPLRFVSEALGAKVSWHQASQTALISSPPAEEDTEAPGKPVVNPVSDISQSVSGTSEPGSRVIIAREGHVIGESKTGADGRFTVTIPVQKAEAVLTAAAIDRAGNESQAVSITVAYTNKFTDTDGHWAQDAVGYLKDQGITNGRADGSFGVSEQITRAESAALLERALPLQEEITAPSFPDVPESHYYYDSITGITANGIMKGNPNGYFYPSRSLTRAEMASVIMNAFDLESSSAAKFPDVKKDHWGYEAIQAIVSNGLAEGYPDNTFRPDAPITRAEFASILAAVLQKQPAKNTPEQSAAQEQPAAEESETAAKNPETQQSEAPTTKIEDKETAETADESTNQESTETINN